MFYGRKNLLFENMRGENEMNCFSKKKKEKEMCKGMRKENKICDFVIKTQENKFLLLIGLGISREKVSSLDKYHHGL